MRHLPIFKITIVFFISIIFIISCKPIKATAAKPKLSRSKITLAIGEDYTLKIKNA